MVDPPTKANRAAASSLCCHASPFLCSYYLYTYDKMVAPNVSLRREAEVNPDMLGALLRQHYGHRAPDEPPVGE